MIAHDALNIQGIAHSRLAQSTSAGGWGQFLPFLPFLPFFPCLPLLHSKAAGAGAQVIAVIAVIAVITVITVPPATTTSHWSAAGAWPGTSAQRKRLRKRLRARAHGCPSCGDGADRDHNAAQTLLRLGRRRSAFSLPMGGGA